MPVTTPIAMTDEQLAEVTFNADGLVRRSCRKKALVAC